MPSLTWREIDWERGRIRVRSPKTEHHAGGESRIIPLFPELRPYLDAIYDKARERSTFVIEQYRHTNQNLRSRMLDIIWAAGLKEWPKLFQNMRSTRETEWAERFPMHVVTKWIGNSEPAAAKHYLQLTDEHFQSAIEGGAESGAQVAQKPAQQPAAKCRNASQETRRAPENKGSVRVEAEHYDMMRLHQVAEAGLEPARELLPKDFKSLASANSATRPVAVSHAGAAKRRTTKLDLRC